MGTGAWIVEVREPFCADFQTGLNHSHEIHFTLAEL